MKTKYEISGDGVTNLIIQRWADGMPLQKTRFAKYPNGGVNILQVEVDGEESTVNLDGFEAKRLVQWLLSLDILGSGSGGVK